MTIAAIRATATITMAKKTISRRVHLVCQNSDRAPTRATHSLDAGSVVSHGVGVISLAEAIAPPISS
jgi:hypothetical protein